MSKSYFFVEIMVFYLKKNQACGLNQQKDQQKNREIVVWSHENISKSKLPADKQEQYVP